ncbi:axin-1-like isoform X2 [Acanthaster planci]|uniref:Axin-1-like isoform X2 n=1 Tax=Acanthaster planci TaxID=133434 RepID=A0A8B7XX35_ACAPL|nr:axin-1-like isoform X2 [Acanthaster planci]
MTLQVHHYMADCGGNFTENLPTSQRPPVPGEENETAPTCAIAKERSPSATPRRSTLLAHVKTGLTGDMEEDEAPLGFEPEGSASVTPPYTRWTESLHALLSDEDGICLFKQFLVQEKAEDPLLFWLATEGFKKKSADDPKRNELAKVIYKKFVKADGQQVVKLSPALRTNIAGMVRSSVFDETLFDAAQAEVEEHIRESTYPMFLKSDLYVQYINNGGISPKSSECSSSGGNSRVTGYLPTLPEDAELTDIPSGDAAAISQGQVPLTMEMLMKTSFHRHAASKTQEGCYLKGSSARVLNPYHPGFTSFAPAVSTNDSELQSLSSDAISDDTLSLTDSSVDGGPMIGRHQKQQQRRRQYRAMKTNVRQNGRVTSFPPFPITQRPPKEVQPMEPAEFARILTEKLERVLRQQEMEERLSARLRKVEEEESDPDRTASAADAPRISAAMFEKGALPEDDPNSILDNHFSRVFVDSARHTPGDYSPRSQSPERAHRAKNPNPLGGPLVPPGMTTKQVIPHHQLPQQYSKHAMQRQRTKEAYTPGYNVDPEMSLADYKYFMQHKAKIEMDAVPQRTLAVMTGEPGDSIYHKLRARGDSLTMDLLTDTTKHVKTKKSSKKSDISSISKTTDSGIYEGPPSLPSDNERMQHIEQWIEEGERYSKQVVSKPYRRTSHRMSPDITQTSSMPQHRQSMPKKPIAYNTSRPTSQERTYCATKQLPQRSSPHLPTQPIMQDPSMPLNKPPEPLTVLEEVRRRIDVSSKQRQRHSDGMRKERRPTSNNPPTRVTSAPAKMAPVVLSDTTEDQGRKSGSKQRSVAPPDGKQTTATTVAYYFCNDPIPYRTTLPGDKITLAQFKTLISKKGDYRYTFKTPSDEFDTGVVHEIISDDATVLPIYQGKIIGKVEKID